MKFRSLLGAAAAVALIAGNISPPTGTRYFTQSVPPDAGLIRLAGRSHISLIADLFWIRAIGATINLKVPADGLVLIAWCDLVTKLDPQFVWPYLLGGLLGPMSFGERHYNAKEGDALLERGMAAIPRDYRLPMYLSYNQLYMEGDARAAAETLRKGATIPGAPLFMGQLATRLLSQSNDFEAARSFAAELEQNSTDPEVRALFRERRLEIERDEQLARLQQLVETFRAARGRAPETLEELVAEKLIPELPPEPMGGQFFIGRDGVVRSTTGERLKAHVPVDTN